MLKIVLEMRSFVPQMQSTAFELVWLISTLKVCKDYAPSKGNYWDLALNG